MDSKREHERLSSERLKSVIKIQSELRFSLGKFLRNEGFIEISPVIISDVTDPLFHSVEKKEIEYSGRIYKLTQSMIFQKQYALLNHPKIFAFSPNIRCEAREFSETKRHLIEFTQLDLEVKGMKRDEIMEIGEKMVTNAISDVETKCKSELDSLGRSLKMPTMPFKIYKYLDAYKKYGPDFESILSYLQTEPFWVIDFPKERREFYDKEDPKREGVLLDMDLIYPEGYGEALSGGEREHEYGRIIKRILDLGFKPQEFSSYLDLAKYGLPPSSGFGIGIERMTRWLCGLESIAETTLFPKLPG
jgi:asparaginyl-tRNA synthetase